MQRRDKAVQAIKEALKFLQIFKKIKKMNIKIN